MDLADQLLGARAANTYAFQSLQEVGTLLALGSDAPVSSENPFLGFHAAFCRQRVERMASGPWYPNECLSLPQTIAGYTLDAARAGGWADAIGSLEPGKRADLIMLDRDIFALAEQGISGGELAETKVLMTIFDGKIVYEA